MSKGAFYHYFTSKEQLFRELVNNVFSSVLDVPYDSFSKESLYNFYIDYVNYYVENLKQQSKSGEDSAPSFNYISLIFDTIKLFPEFTEKCIEIGERIGRLDDKPVAKGCTSSFAPEWIRAAINKKK